MSIFCCHLISFSFSFFFRVDNCSVELLMNVCPIMGLDSHSLPNSDKFTVGGYDSCSLTNFNSCRSHGASLSLASPFSEFFYAAGINMTESLKINFISLSFIFSLSLFHYSTYSVIFIHHSSYYYSKANHQS